MLSRLLSGGMSNRAFFFLIPSRRGENDRGGVFGLIRFGPGRDSNSCCVNAIHSVLLCGDSGCSGWVDGKTELGRTLLWSGRPPKADAKCEPTGMKDDWGPESKSP